MAEHPIIFSGPMVRALLDGRKTMTRRLAWRSETDHKRMTFVCDGERPDPLSRPAERAGIQWGGRYYLRPTPWQKVLPGDTLWVRESWAHDGPDLATVRAAREDALSGGISYGPYYRATEIAPGTLKWRPSIHMPRWASRINLTVTAVRVEKLQDITEEDARAEGVLYVPGHGDITLAELHADPGYSNYLCCRMGFEALWNSLHGPGAWDANPSVVVLSFERTKS